MGALRVRTGRLGLVLTLITVIVGMGSWTPASSAAGTAVQVTFDGTGTYTIDQTYQYSGGTCTTHDVWTLHWTSVFQSTLDNGVLGGAQGAVTSGSPGTADMTVGGICTYQNTVPSCTTTLSAPTGQPNLAVSGTSPERLDAQSLVGTVSAGCSDATDGPFIGRDAYFFDQALPDAVTAIADVPPDKLVPGSSTPVSSSNAPGSTSGNCTGQGPAAGTNTSCSYSFSWDGTIRLDCKGGKGIGKITLSEGDAPPVGTVVCDGETLRTGQNSRLEITFNDGSVMRLGPNSEAEVDSQSEITDSDRQITVHLILGTIWAKVSAALGGNDQFEMTSDRAVVGVRGCEVTGSVAPGSKTIVYHVIQGKGFIRLPGKAEQHFPAGYTATVSPTSYKLSTIWPASQQALVPPAYLPPKLTTVKLAGSNLGPNSWLSYRLDHPAAVVVQVMSGKRVLASFKARGRAGLNKLRLNHKPLKKGEYDVVVSATRNKLTSLAYLELKAK